MTPLYPKRPEDASFSAFLTWARAQGHDTAAAALQVPSPSVSITVDGTPLWLSLTPAGDAERDRLEWAFMARTLRECRTLLEADGSRQTWLGVAEAIAAERAR